jgi:hypothetical protein
VHSGSVNCAFLADHRCRCIAYAYLDANTIGIRLSIMPTYQFGHGWLGGPVSARRACVRDVMLIEFLNDGAFNIGIIVPVAGGSFAHSSDLLVPWMMGWDGCFWLFLRAPVTRSLYFILYYYLLLLFSKKKTNLHSLPAPNPSTSSSTPAPPTSGSSTPPAEHAICPRRPALTRPNPPPPSSARARGARRRSTTVAGPLLGLLARRRSV